jgi:hypothetical protein
MAMPLRSQLFKGDPKLEACLLYDQSHILTGARGDHVAKIQTALRLVDNLVIDGRELSAKSYEKSTAAAVLSFKQKRRIINYSYETQADNIVGKMTIAALDQEVYQRENPIDPQNDAICLLPDYVKLSQPRNAAQGFVAASAPPPAAAPTPKDVAKADVPEARQWMFWARIWLFDAECCAADPTLEASDPKRFGPRVAACDTHFHFRAKAAGDQEAFLARIRGNYDKMLDLTKDPDTYFADDLKVYPPGDVLLRAWAHAPIGRWNNGKKEAKVFFRGIFAAVRGQKCRCAMIIHECAHSCADGKHFANDWPFPNGEGDNPDGKGKRSTDYAHLAPDDAAANCCSYAAFAANARFASDTRPGAHDLTV